MNLTNGQWPPRGLLTGRWPPDHARGSLDGDPATSGAKEEVGANAGFAGTKAWPPTGASERAESTGQVQRGQEEPIFLVPADVPSMLTIGRSARRGATYSHIIHCGSIRQEARVIAMQELPHEHSEQQAVLGGVNMTAAAAAAAVLLEYASGGEAEEGEEESSDGAGTLVDVLFQFSGRQEWLVPGMRFVVRDQRGHVSGVGVVHSVGKV